MEEDALISVGFSKNEAKVYLSLLRMGSSTAGGVASKCDIHRTNVYDALDRLTEKGLVTYVYKGNKKFFEAVDPTRIKELLRERLSAIEEAIPTLMLNYKLATTKDKVHTYDGLVGVKVLTDDMLRDGKDICVFGIPKDVPDRLKTILPLFHRRRIAKKIMMQHIYDANAQERIRYLNTLPYTKAMFISRDEESPATTLVYGNKVAFVIWSTPPLNIIIESERMAVCYRHYFNILLEKAKKPTER